MKKRRLYKITSVLLVLLLLVSCAPLSASEASSAMTKNESSLFSSETSKEETSSLPATSDKENTVSKKSEEEANSNKPVSSVPSTSSQSTTEQEDGLSKERVNEISACIKKDNYEYQKGQYFGTYNQYDVVLISKINGVEYRDSQVMKIDEYGFL